MNIDSLRSNGHCAPSLEPQWHRHVHTWRCLLEKCVRKPSRKQIRSLRSFTLRLRVATEFWMLERTQDATAARAFKRWNKETKKLRRALQPVRDADAHLAKLDLLRVAFSGTPDSNAQLSTGCRQEIANLKNRLKQMRLVEMEKLMAFFDARARRLNRRGKEMEVALASGMPLMARPAIQAALQVFARLVSELPALDGSNLHAYRKRLKQALYLAEISATDNPLAGRIAGEFKKIHDATGEWHDWQALALAAARMLPGNDDREGLIPVLEARAEEALQRALALCRGLAATLMESAGPTQAAQRRKPVAIDRGCQPSDKYTPLAMTS